MLLIFLLSIFYFPLSSSAPIPQNGSNQTEEHRAQMGYKSLTQLANIGKCQMVDSGRWSAWQAIWMVQYGCYCGPLNRGNAAVDEIDRCCEEHDACYDDYNANWASQCGWTFLDRSPYTEFYGYKCDAGTGYQVECDAKNNKPCEQFLCECDKKLVDCWVNQPKPFENKGCSE